VTSIVSLAATDYWGHMNLRTSLRDSLDRACSSALPGLNVVKPINYYPKRAPVKKNVEALWLKTMMGAKHKTNEKKMDRVNRPMGGLRPVPEWCSSRPIEANVKSLTPASLLLLMLRKLYREDASYEIWHEALAEAEAILANG